MTKRRSLWDVIPFSTVIGVAVLIAMAFVAELQPFIVYVALLVIAYTLFRSVVQASDAEDRIAALKAPEKLVKVQPQGPSFQEVLRALPEPVMVVAGYEPDDIAARWIVFANAAAQATFQIRGEGGSLVSAIRNPEVLECVDEALFGGLTGSVDFDTNGGARDRFWRAFAAPLPVDGAMKGEASFQRLAVVVIRDETDVRRMEKMRADFLANASHELRTPLASISGFIETLRGPARDDEMAREKFLPIMAAQAERMGRLINDLLSLSRIEMNEHVPPAGETDLVLAVSDVVDSLTVIAQQKKVRLKLESPRPGLYPITGERDQIVQVVQNLVDNALKYAPIGSEVSVKVRFDMRLQDAATPCEPQAARLVLLRPDRNMHDYYACITIRDQGPGIRREHLPRLAERFYRVEGQKSGDRLGTGLGLAIVKHIVNRHRGGLAVESIGANGFSDEDLAHLERTPPAPKGGAADSHIASLPAAPPATYTAFSVWLPQKGAYGVGQPVPRLVVEDERKGAAGEFKDAG
ncbi:ATP-binding protein [Asticcacaulis sp. EMRT-3]|uniref:sensor histidine kinase n=1 Tax=Asticcacaulis sp. EMRT-3 TaxID=3040349 RepID=UPI0024AEEDC0|nr:ATP-binding protein [Asticcacaulis sp. EMRT-3]MDI7775618.1 ATP-binding protein [Asticcacaulis sp. EMRT-3]